MFFFRRDSLVVRFGAHREREREEKLIPSLSCLNLLSSIGSVCAQQKCLPSENKTKQKKKYILNQLGSNCIATYISGWMTRFKLLLCIIIIGVHEVVYSCWWIWKQPKYKFVIFFAT